MQWPEDGGRRSKGRGRKSETTVQDTEKPRASQVRSSFGELDDLLAPFGSTSRVACLPRWILTTGVWLLTSVHWGCGGELRSIPAPEGDLRIDQQKLGMALQQFLAVPANKALYDSVVLLYQTDMKLYEEKILSLAPRIQKEMGVSVIKDFPADRLEAYTTVGGAPHLDDEYTVFGQVIQGLDVIDKIVALPRSMENRPLEDVRMFVTVEEMPRKKITKLYGYEYPEIKK